MKKVFLLFAFPISLFSGFAQNTGVGTTSPQSRLHVNGTSWFSGDNTPLPAAAGKGIAIGSAGENGYIYAFDYGTFTPKNLLLQSPGGNVGIGTATPASKLTVHTSSFGIEHTDGLRRLSTYLSPSGGWIGTISNHPLHFYTNNSGQQMSLTQSGQLGVGTTTPLAGYRLDIAGGTRTFGDAAHFVAQATGGTNSWARFYMRSSAQSWLVGTSQNFNGNQLYVTDETFGHTRFAIQPNNGPIYMQGNTTQDIGGFGQPKAMVYVNGDGTMLRCYNGITGSSSGGCGLITGRIFSSQGVYQITFPFEVSTRFVTVTVQNGPASGQATPSYSFNSATQLWVTVLNSTGVPTDRPMMVIIY